MTSRRVFSALAALTFSMASATAYADDTSPAPAAGPADGPAAGGVTGETSAADKAEPPREEWKATDVEELPNRWYIFLGARYRGVVVPKFLLNAFVDEGATIMSHTVGLEAEFRKDGFSLIPALTYTEYGTDDLIFKQKNVPDIVGNYSYVNSSLKSINATLDVLWSTRVGKGFAFEYGLAVGIGTVFGDLVTNWVRFDDNGPYRAPDSGRRFGPCQTVDAPGTGCNAADHQNSAVDKVGGYTEPSWVNGGSKPNFFPYLTPVIGFRYKPVKQFQARLGLGFGLTGPWFGISGDYGLEQRPQGATSETPAR